MFACNYDSCSCQQPAVCLQGMFAEVVGCTMLASSIFLTYALIVVVRATGTSL
jgi:hypothetical protein